MGAITKIQPEVFTAWSENHRSRKVVVLVNFDVRNAFNTLRWSDWPRDRSSDRTSGNHREGDAEKQGQMGSSIPTRRGCPEGKEEGGTTSCSSTSLNIPTYNVEGRRSVVWLTLVAVRWRRLGCKNSRMPRRGLWVLTPRFWSNAKADSRNMGWQDKG